MSGFFASASQFAEGSTTAGANVWEWKGLRGGGVEIRFGGLHGTWERSVNFTGSFGGFLRGDKRIGGGFPFDVGRWPCRRCDLEEVHLGLGECQFGV